ncbi:ester cyclase [Kutzneria sp. NPDC052558]|uniref:ester cyclase n=1 Tax=Kutzneria sp. NPDC052558 TaxID=3364121 RepID=UPI0037CC7229
MTAAVDRALADPTLTAEERANLELVLHFRSVPFAERSKYTVDGFKPQRFGMANLAEVAPPGSVTYNGESVPDRVDEIDDILVRGDRVWARWTLRGTHLGELQGIPATGRAIAVTEIGHWRVEDGLIAEAWFMVDELALLRQLGRWPGAQD